MPASRTYAPLSPGKFRAMARLADQHGRFKMLAIDQRGAMRALLTSALGRAPTFEEVCASKRLVVDSLAGEASAVLIDPDYGVPATLDVLPVKTGLIVAIDASDYETTAQGRMARIVPNWSVGKAKRLGADAIKLLAYYSPRAGTAVLDHQHELIRSVGQECARFDMAFMLEPLIYPIGETPDAFARDRAELVRQSTTALADVAFQVDIYKLESPLLSAGLGGDPSRQALLTSHFERMTAGLPAPWVILSAAAAPADFAAVMSAACAAGAGGYLAGRSIWKTAVEQFPSREEVTHRLQSAGVPYMRELNVLTDRLVAASQRQVILATLLAPADFPQSYPGSDKD
jgi:tagatose 1,6-diphosphate aldolase